MTELTEDIMRNRFKWSSFRRIILSSLTHDPYARIHVKLEVIGSFY